MKNILHLIGALFTLTQAFAQAPDSVLVELPNQRTYFSKTYYNARDNTYTARISPSYVHYLAADGTFKDIDTNLRLDKSGAYYIIDNGLYNVAFTGDFSKGNWDVAYEVPRPLQPKRFDPGKPPAPSTRLRWKVLSYGYYDHQQNVYQVIQYPNTVTPLVSGNTISYPEIFSGIDIRYICGNVSIKEEIVLSQFGRDALPDPTKYGLSRSSYFVVAMEFLLTPNNINVFARRQAGKIPIKQGNNFSFDGDDPIEFEDADSTLHFFFPKDYAWTINDSATGFANQTSLRRYFYSDRGKDYMLVGVPWSWIDSAPEGDLIIDPTTSVATSEDVWLESTSNNDGNSAGLLIGKAADPYPKKRTIIKFNIAGSGIPSSATVLNAQMKLYYYSAANGGSGSWVDRWVQAHQLLVNWAEAQATRDNRLTGTPWNVAYVGLNDIDAKSGYESTLLFQSGQTGTWKAWNLTALTQKWVNGTATNYGVVLWATNETTNGYDLRFHSSDAPPPNNANPPVLEVTYSTDAATKTVYFLKDHLGSIRATVLDSATAPVIGYDDYDPWGYPLALRTKPIPNAYLQGASKNKFTGKEWDDEFGVNLVWVERRPYDSAIGRWVVHDPGNDYYSPYVYVRNNPIVAIDPNGEETYFVNGAGNDPSKWGYSQKIVTALQNAGISDVKHVPITQGQILDQIYSVTANTSDSRYITTRTRFYDDVIIKQRLESNTATLVDAVNKDIAAGNIGSGEQINLVGYSFGSVVTANAALELASKGTTVNNLVLIGSMVSTNSDLYKALSSNSNIKNIIRIDIPNDRFSNPKGIKDFIKGVIDALEKGDKLPHFIYALPQNDKEREELAKQLYDAGVR